MKSATLIFFIQVILYSVVCVNFRAIAQTDYPVALASDFVLASLNFFLIRKIARAEDSLGDWVGYVLGSLAGSALGIYVSASHL